MCQTGIVLLQMSPVTRPVARAAAQEAYPAAEVMETGTEAEASRWIETHRPSVSLLVLTEPDAALTRRVLAAHDPCGRKRWAVVIMGHSTGGTADSLPPEDWNSRTLARSLRAAGQGYELRAQNHRLHGDLSTMLRRFTHDCRTHLSSIMIACEVLKERQEIARAAGADMTRIIDDSAAELERLVERVTFVLKASESSRAMVPVDMAAIVDATLHQLDLEIRQKEARINPPTVWPAVSGVGEWLTVIWGNLLRNALQHGGPAAQVSITWEICQDQVRFSVIDRGPGVAAHQRAGLFCPFERLHAAQVTGLGLSLVQRLVQLQGGHCGQQQEADGGTCFYFTLPLRFLHSRRG